MRPRRRQPLDNLITLTVRAAEPVLTLHEGVWWAVRSWLTTIRLSRPTWDALCSQARLEGYPSGCITPYIEDRLEQLARPEVARRLPRPRPGLQRRGAAWARGRGRPKRPFTRPWLKKSA